MDQLDDRIDMEGLPWVRSRVDPPVMADESVDAMRNLDRILLLDAANMIDVRARQSAARPESPWPCSARSLTTGWDHRRVGGGDPHRRRRRPHPIVQRRVRKRTQCRYPRCYPSPRRSVARIASISFSMGAVDVSWNSACTALRSSIAARSASGAAPLPGWASA